MVNLLLLFLLVSNLGICQSVNLIIQVNDKLVESGFTDIHLKLIVGEEAKTISVNYVPGDLVLNLEAWNLINSDSSVKISLHFNYNGHHSNTEETAHFYVDLTRDNLKQKYLILNIYDFTNKKYKRWYQWHTKNQFLAELKFPNSGAYIRKK